MASKGIRSPLTTNQNCLHTNLTAETKSSENGAVKLACECETICKGSEKLAVRSIVQIRIFVMRA